MGRDLGVSEPRVVRRAGHEASELAARGRDVARPGVSARPARRAARRRGRAARGLSGRAVETLLHAIERGVDVGERVAALRDAPRRTTRGSSRVAAGSRRRRRAKPCARRWCSRRASTPVGEHLAAAVDQRDDGDRSRSARRANAAESRDARGSECGRRASRRAPRGSGRARRAGTGTAAARRTRSRPRRARRRAGRAGPARATRAATRARATRRRAGRRARRRRA